MCVNVFFFPPNSKSGSSRADPTQKQGKQFRAASRKSSTTQKDITTPITTVPTINIPTIPIINPASSNPDTVSPAMTTPSFTPSTTISGGSSWCIASQSASQAALQLALDYACGIGGADCSSIQGGGNCYNPNSVRDHASYAFNSYYQKNPLPNSCNFGGTAVITSTNPSKFSFELLFLLACFSVIGF